MIESRLALFRWTAAPTQSASRQLRLHVVRRPQERKGRVLSPSQTDRIVTTSPPPPPRLALTLAGTIAVASSSSIVVVGVFERKDRLYRKCLISDESRKQPKEPRREALVQKSDCRRGLVAWGRCQATRRATGMPSRVMRFSAAQPTAASVF